MVTKPGSAENKRREIFIGNVFETSARYCDWKTKQQRQQVPRPTKEKPTSYGSRVELTDWFSRAVIVAPKQLRSPACFVWNERLI